MPPDISACPGNPRGGHWWICDAPVSRLSYAFCKLCGAERDDLANYPAEVYGSHRKEADLSLTADERQKRHEFYESHKLEIIATYEELSGNVKGVAEKLSKEWKVEVPTTTIYGLLRAWKVPRKARAKKSKKGRTKKPTSTPGVTFQGEIVGLEKVDGGFKMVVFVATTESFQSMTESLKAPVHLEIV